MKLADKSSAAEKRKETRRRVLKAGMLIFGEPPTPTAVTICDLSSGGARVKLSDGVMVSSKAALLVVAESLLYPVQIRWRHGEQIGVSFEGQPELQADKASKPH